MKAYTELMSTAPAAPVPVRRSILRAATQPAPAPAARPECGPFADWRDATPTELLPAVPSAAVPARPRVSTHRKPTGSREGHRTAPTGTKGLRRLARHLRAALAGLLIAAALLTGLQLYAAAGISSARQAALEQARTHASAAPLSGQSTYTPTSPMPGQSDPKPDWVTEHTGAAYDRTNPAASPLDLPRCTTSPDTPLPCLATISPSQTRAVVLEEDASLTALVRR